MPDPSTVGVVALASLALAVVPGPAVLYIVARSVSQGRAAGIVSDAGIHLGTLVHVAAAVVGLSALLMRSTLAFSAVKYAGAAYLVYLGISKFRERYEERCDILNNQSRNTILKQGVVVQILNVKTGLFFLAFLPQFVDAGRGDGPLQLFILGVVFIIAAMCSDVMYAVVSPVSATGFDRAKSSRDARDGSQAPSTSGSA